MRKKYRIKTTIELEEVAPLYIVQVRTWLGLWVTIKPFYEPYDPDFARREAEELLDKLNEK
jgi:hypothetical protein|nr:MAG TPA: hypothetical protein [Caudoviricetes sp.]